MNDYNKPVRVSSYYPSGTLLCMQTLLFETLRERKREQSQAATWVIYLVN